MRYLLLVGVMLLFPTAPARGQVSVQFGLPSVRIGIHQPVFPRLVLVPGYPVYYAPGSNANYFFYDGMYWVFAGDNWYASDWYDGPWSMVEPQYVPVYVLRVPVRYYRSPPPYFRGWYRDAPPRWGVRWGHDWEREHRGWDRWRRQDAPRPAPLPVYQRQFSGGRYPQPQEQRRLHVEQYRHEPRDPTVRQRFWANPPERRDAPGPNPSGWPGARPQPRVEQPGATPAAQPTPAPGDRLVDVEALL